MKSQQKNEKHSGRKFFLRNNLYCKSFFFLKFISLMMNQILTKVC